MMRITFLENSIEMKVLDNKNDLIALLKGCDHNFLLGEGVESEGNFYYLAATTNQSRNVLGVGICSEAHGLTPQLFIHEETETLWFGFNSNAVGISFRERKLFSPLELDSVFYRFIPIFYEKRILVQHEIGIISLDFNGRIIWKFSKDIITKMEISGNTIKLQFMDSSPVSLNIENGDIG